MTKEASIDNGLLETEVVVAMNLLVDAKKVNPESKQHETTLINLAEIAASKPGAIDIMFKLQNGK